MNLWILKQVYTKLTYKELHSTAPQILSQLAHTKVLIHCDQYYEDSQVMDLFSRLLALLRNR